MELTLYNKYIVMNYDSLYTSIVNPTLNCSSLSPNSSFKILYALSPVQFPVYTFSIPVSFSLSPRALDLGQTISNLKNMLK